MALIILGDLLIFFEIFLDKLFDFVDFVEFDILEFFYDKILDFGEILIDFEIFLLSLISFDFTVVAFV